MREPCMCSCAGRQRRWKGAGGSRSQGCALLLLVSYVYAHRTAVTYQQAVPVSLFGLNQGKVPVQVCREAGAGSAGAEAAALCVCLHLLHSHDKPTGSRHTTACPSVYHTTLVTCARCPRLLAACLLVCSPPLLFGAGGGSMSRPRMMLHSTCCWMPPAPLSVTWLSVAPQ
jgi:hypothetical protein